MSVSTSTLSSSLYKRIFFLAAPMALQNIIAYSVGMADNLMVGSLGELALSGVYVANQLQNILHMLTTGLGASLIILASQYWGRNDEKNTRAIVGIGLKFSVAAAFIFLILTLLFPNQILNLFTNEAAVHQEALQYLKIIRYTYIFFAITQILIAAMRCVEQVRIGLILSALTFFVNVSLNWILIYGKLGFPALGIRGAALATLIARMIETPTIIIYVRFIDKKLKLRFRELLKSQRVLVKDFFKYGFPVILGDIFWGFNLATQGAIMGRLGPTALASVSIANNFFSMVGVGVYGTAAASAVIIGQAVGANAYDRLKEYTKKLQVLFIIVGIVSGGILYLSSDYILTFYNLTTETLIMAKQFLTVLAVMIIGTSYQMSVLTGIVRAGGSIYFVLVNDLIFVWLIVIPSALIATFLFKAHPVIVFMCLKSDQILKCFVAFIKVNRFDWIKNLTHTENE